MPKKVLIIDDDKTIREYVSDILTAEGYYVIEKGNAEEGLERLLKKNSRDRDAFDIIICDIMMPGADGFEVLKRLRHTKITMPLFIYITANKEREFLRTAMESGADDYITKPFTPEELLKSIRVQEAKKQTLIKSFAGNEPDLKKKNKSEITSKVKTGRTQKFLATDKIFISNKEKAGFINIKDIVAVQSLKDYTRLYTTSKDVFYIRKPLKRWEASLPADIFLLVNRSTLINTSYISSINKLPNNTHEVSLKNFSHKVTISRRISTKLKNIIKKI